MNSNSGAIDFESYIKTDQFKKGMDYMDRRVLGFTRTAVSETQKVENSFARLGTLAAGAFAGFQLTQLPGQIIKVRGEFQQLEIALSTMLQSKVKADKLMGEIVQTASTTPFGLKDLAGGTKQLLAYGSAADTVMGEIRMLGDVASGVSAPINDLIYLYGTLRTQGRAYAVDIRQFAGRGIPIYAELAKVLKVNVSEVNALVEAGKVGFPQVEQAFRNMTSGAGMFSGLMEAQSKSIPGLIERLKDGIDVAFNEIGKSNQGLIEETIKGASIAVEHYQDIIDVLKVVIATYGTYRAALMLTATAQASTGIVAGIKMWYDLAKSVNSARDAQILFSLATRANPYVIAATALVALAGAFTLVKSESEEATKSQERALAIKEKLNQKYADETSKIQILTRQISNEARSRDERNAKLKELVAISPAHFKALTLDNIATDKGAAAIRAYSKALEEKLKLQATEEQILANNKRIRDISTGVLDEEYKPGMGERVKLFFEDSGFDENKFKATTEKRKRAAIEALKDENHALINEAAKSATSGSVKPPEVPKPPKDKAKATAKAESEIRIKTFSEELQEKQALYELHQRWIDHYGEQAADDQFKSLLSNGKSYMDYLEREIARLETMKNVGYSGKLSDTDANDLDNLLDLKRQASNEKTSLDQFKEQLIDAKGEAKTLAEYLDKLYKTRTDLGTPTGANAQDKSIFLTTEIQETERALKTSLNDFLDESANYAQKRIQIEQKYNTYRKGAVLKFTKEELEVELDNIETRRKAELESLADEELEKSDSYQRLHEEIKYFNKAQLKQRIANIEEDLKREEISIKKKIQLEKGLAAAKKALNNNSLENLKIAGNVISQALGDVTLEFTEQFKLNLRDLGSAIEGAASLASFDFQGASTGDKAAAVGNIIQIHSFLITSVRDAFKTASDFFTGMEGQDGYFKQLQNQIEGVNILLERQQYLLGNMTESEKLGGGTMALINAQAKAQEDALQGLKDLSIDVIKSADKVFVDPIFGSEVKAKGFWGVYTQLATAGKAETKIKYSFQQIDTSGFTSIEDYINLLADIKKNGGMIDGKQVVDADLQALELLIKTYQEAEEKQKQLLEDFRKFLTATTEAGIADSIVAGLQAGKSSAADFAEDFETMMRNAVINSLKAQIMDQKLAAYYKKFGQYAASDGVLDKDEQRELKSDWDGIVSSSKALYDQMEAVTGLDLSKELLAAKTDPLRGAIQGMSQETASVLAGQFNSLRISGADTASSMRQMLLYQANISRNSDFQKHLPILNELLKEMKTSNTWLTRGFGG
jgi:hypothetical protein